MKILDSRHIVHLMKYQKNFEYLNKEYKDRSYSLYPLHHNCNRQLNPNKFDKKVDCLLSSRTSLHYTKGKRIPESMNAKQELYLNKRSFHLKPSLMSFAYLSIVDSLKLLEQILGHYCMIDNQQL